MLPSAPSVAALVLISRHGEHARTVAGDALRSCEAAGDTAGERAWSDVLAELSATAERAERRTEPAGAYLH